MIEYYKLSLLKKTKDGAVWDEIYLEMNGEKSRVMDYGFRSNESRPLNSKLEKISDEEAKEILR
ncbi:hypothetical protein ES703_84966 [subsurface metagenome]